MSVQTELSVGEFLDKISILQIKVEKIENQSKLENIQKGLQILMDTWSNSPYTNADITEEMKQLKEANEQLWGIEDDIRDKESEKGYGDQFVQPARSVYFTNDKRADIKKN